MSFIKLNILADGFAFKDAVNNSIFIDIFTDIYIGTASVPACLLAWLFCCLRTNKFLSPAPPCLSEFDEGTILWKAFALPSLILLLLLPPLPHHFKSTKLKTFRFIDTTYKISGSKALCKKDTLSI